MDLIINELTLKEWIEWLSTYGGNVSFKRYPNGFIIPFKEGLSIC